MPKAEDTAPPGDGRNWGIRDLMHLQNVLLLLLLLLLLLVLSGTSLDSGGLSTRVLENVVNSVLS